MNAPATTTPTPRNAHAGGVRPIRPEAEFPILRAAAWLGLWTVMLAAVVHVVLSLQDATRGFTKLNLLAAAVCGGSGLVGLLPVWWTSRNTPDAGAMGFLAGILFRMFVAGGAVLYAMWGTDWAAAQTFSLWVAGWYLAVLLIEVKLVSSHVLKYAGPAAPGNNPGNSSGNSAGINPDSLPETTSEGDADPGLETT